MRRSTLWMCALLVTATSGCDRVKGLKAQAAALGKSLQEKVELARQRFFHKKPAPGTPAAPAPATPVAGTPAKPGPAAAPPGKPGPAAAQRPTPLPQESQALALSPPHLRDEPYVSDDTGTVAPGMSEKDVYSLWGSPVAVRRMGQYTYIYFKNGCEYTCGHLDVVTLENGQVVDAIVRWPGHNYSGQSSSPTSTEPHGPPPGGDNLKVKRDTT